MYNAGPDESFSTNVTLNNVSISNPNTSLQTGQVLIAPITAGSITGLAYTDIKLPVSINTALEYSVNCGAMQ